MQYLSSQSDTNLQITSLFATFMRAHSMLIVNNGVQISLRPTKYMLACATS